MEREPQGTPLHKFWHCPAHAAVRFEGAEHLKSLSIDNVPHHMLLGIPGTYDAMPNEHFAPPLPAMVLTFMFWAALASLSRAYPALRPLVLQRLRSHALTIWTTSNLRVLI